MAKKLKDTDTVITEEKTSMFLDAATFLNRPQVIIPFSPTFDMLLGGGIPEGSFCIFSGPPKFGKTVSALSFSSNAQKPEYQGTLDEPRKVVYVNIEHRLKPRDLHGINGLDTSRLEIIESKAGEILSAEQYLTKSEEALNTYPGCILIIDSFSQLCSSAEQSEGMEKLFRADVPKMLSKFCRRNCSTIAINKCVVIGITHQMANPTGYGVPWSEKSGESLKYQVDVKIVTRKREFWKLTDDSAPIGQIVDWTCESSAIGAPGQKSQSYIRYGYGVDREMELLAIAVDTGLIKRGGAWYTFEFVKGEQKPKFQGMENSRNALLDKELFNVLQKEINMLLGLKY